MSRRNYAFARPNWMPGEGDEASEMLWQRRWRIMQNVLPFDTPLEPLPAWVRTPDQFVGWLSCRLDQAGLRAYFRDIQAVAKQIGDLALLRFAPRYLGDI
jgi:hypothetical protein